jgi:hypothetical protein
MHRARLAGLALIGLGMLVTSIGVSIRAPAAPPFARAAAVGWPVATGLLIAEVVTGGGSASDEFVELANIGTTPVDLAGFEMAYASAAGTTATRKVGWSVSRVVDPGRHVLLANAAGVFAASADATWTVGIAATGGTIVLRTTAGATVDAVGWGDATNTWVEGSPAPAPAAGSSIERRGVGGVANARDTNQNAADLVVQPAPVPQNLAWDPVPTPSPDPPATPSATPEATPSPTAKPTPTATPTPSP